MSARMLASTDSRARARPAVSPSNTRVASSAAPRRATAMPQTPATFTAATATMDNAMSHPARERPETPWADLYRKGRGARNGPASDLTPEGPRPGSQVGS